MAWLESEQAAVQHGYHKQVEVLVTRDSLDKNKASVNMEAHMSSRAVLTTGNAT